MGAFSLGPELMRMLRFQLLLHPVIRVSVFLPRPSHVRGVWRLSAGGRFTAECVGGASRSEHLLGARWKGRSDVPGAASLRETTFRTPRQAHWPETDWGALHPPAPSSEGHPRTGRVSEEAHEPKDQSSKHVRARWGRASVGGQRVGRIQQLF